LLEHDETAPNLVDRRGLLLPDIARLPRRRNLTPDRGDLFLLLWGGQVGAIPRGERRGDPVVLLHEPPARYLGWVGGQDELDTQTANGLVQLIGCDTGCQKTPEAVFARSALRRKVAVALVVAAAPSEDRPPGRSQKENCPNLLGGDWASHGFT
jgi:hypothetical protein